MGIMTCRARSIIGNYMLIVFLKAGIIEDTASVMAAVTKFIIEGIFYRNVLRCVIEFQEIFEYRPVGACRPLITIRVVTIGTVNHAGGIPWRQKTRYICICALRFHRVI
jgi:hypothetical protein